MAHASAQQVVEARERVVEAACAYVDAGDASLHRQLVTLEDAVRAFQALTVPKDD